MDEELIRLVTNSLIRDKEECEYSIKKLVTTNEMYWGDKVKYLKDQIRKYNQVISDIELLSTMTLENNKNVDINE